MTPLRLPSGDSATILAHGVTYDLPTPEGTATLTVPPAPSRWMRTVAVAALAAAAATLAAEMRRPAPEPPSILAPASSIIGLIGPAPAPAPKPIPPAVAPKSALCPRCRHPLAFHTATRCASLDPVTLEPNCDCRP